MTFFSDIVTLAAAKTGYTFNTAIMCLGMVQGLSARKQELESQRSTFWNTTGRAPNHYARTIALRFAKLIAKKTGNKPTFGTSRDGSHPSTEYGRALKEIFGILGIEATIKHPANWAIKQLTDEDLQPERVGLFANLLAQRSPDPMNALAQTMLGPAKGTKQ